VFSVTFRLTICYIAKIFWFIVCFCSKF